MIRWLALASLAALSVAAGSAAGDGCPPSSCGTSGSAVPGSRLLVVRPSGQRGPLTVYDLVSRQRRFTLPAGMLSANGRLHVVARSAGGRTTVRRFDARTGTFVGSTSVIGRWRLAGVSPTAGRILLMHFDRQARATRFAFVGGGRFTLRGTYDVETLSPDGRRVFLVHYRSAGYDLERYDVGSRALQPNPPRDEDGVEKMTGSPWTAVATRNGRWLLTLYVKSDSSTFVHALDLHGGPPHCIDLPGRSPRGEFQSTTLVLSPDERTLHVATPQLGRIVEVDLARLRVARTVRFGPYSGDQIAGIGPAAAVSKNGRSVAFSYARSVWRYDTAFHRVGTARGMSQPVAALGFRPGGGLLALQGRRLQTVG